MGDLSADTLVGLVTGGGGALVVLVSWLMWALKEIRRLQKQCNRRTEDYIDLITEMSGLNVPPRRRMDIAEDITNHGN